MSNKFKKIYTKNRTSYFFNDMINITNLDPNSSIVNWVFWDSLFLKHTKKHQIYKSTL